MKGLVLKTLILVIVMLMYIGGFFVFVLMGPIRQIDQQSSRLESEQIAGIINMMQSSSAASIHAMKLPNTCSISIEPSKVTVTIQGKTSKSGIIQTGVNIKPDVIRCENMRNVYFIRCGNEISAVEEPTSCSA